MPQGTTTPSKKHKRKLKASNVSNDRPEIDEEQSQAAQSSYGFTKIVQQNILTHFSDGLSLTPSSQTRLQSTIQSVKSALYARDFTTAFGTEEFRQAYCARWSPSRGLAYAQLLLQENTVLDVGIDGWDIVSLGGGAGAELVGLTVAWDLLRKDLTTSISLNLHFVDIADWGLVLDRLNRGLPGNMDAENKRTVDFHQMDLLAENALERLRPLLMNTDLVTMFFTLNELYAASLAKTTQLLLELGDMLKTGARLFVVDSAGSYAGVIFNQDEDQKENDKNQSSSKRYPMAWMLDHTLLEMCRKKEDRQVWGKLLGDESRWFRRDKTLEYPLPLEDMRYQVHIFERLKNEQD